MTYARTFLDRGGPARPRATAVDLRLDQCLVGCVSASDEVYVLIAMAAHRLEPDMTDAVGERLAAVLNGPDFEDEIRMGPDMAALRLRRLATLGIQVRASTLGYAHRAEISAIVRRLREAIHADAALVDVGASIRPDRRR
jgi:hypothetical protein